MNESHAPFDAATPAPTARPVHEVVDLVDPQTQRFFGDPPATLEEARRAVAADDVEAVRRLFGSFALVTRDGEAVRMARSLDRPLRYFLAKEASGPLLVVAERIDEIRAELERRGHLDQFHPSYTRMVPAHHVLTLRLIGCPDPNPTHRRFFAPPRGVMPPDLDLIGEHYVGALAETVDGWLAAQPDDEPIGVAFSGGIDSGAVLLATYHGLLRSGRKPSRLKAFVLDAGGGEDARQAREFLRRLDLEMLLETIEVEPQAIDPLAAVELIEDYKPLDVECAAVGAALLGEIRRRDPAWRLMIDGDGGDENLKDYPIEENPELTIRSVVGNSMLYQEGWGVEAVKHSLTYSGGLSRGCVRTWAPARRFGFTGFSPFTMPQVIEVAEAIPFDELTRGDHEALYALKGEVVRRGVAHHFGVDMPIFPKRRFQHGVGAGERLSVPPALLRRHFDEVHRPR
ncbi:MAG: asparagine synthase-related protein [Acidobacteriota bacterium]